MILLLMKKMRMLTQQMIRIPKRRKILRKQKTSPRKLRILQRM